LDLPGTVNTRLRFGLVKKRREWRQYRTGLLGVFAIDSRESHPGIVAPPRQSERLSFGQVHDVIAVNVENALAREFIKKSCAKCLHRLPNEGRLANGRMNCAYGRTSRHAAGTEEFWDTKAAFG